MVGYSNGDVSILVKLENGKKPSLVSKDGNVITKYATFTNEGCAVDFMKMLAEFIGSDYIPKELWDGEEKA